MVPSRKKQSEPYSGIGEMIDKMAKGAHDGLSDLRQKVREQQHVSANVSAYGVDFVVSEPGRPMKVLNLSWADVKLLVAAHGKRHTAAKIAKIAEENLK